MKETLERVMPKGRAKYIIIACVVLLVCVSFVIHLVETSGALHAPASAIHYCGENYQDVIKELKAAGFTNIKTQAIDDLVIGFLTKDGEVEEISIGGDSSFSEGKGFDENVEVVIKYHTFPAAKETPKPEETPGVQLSTELEKQIWEIVKNNDGELASIKTVVSEKADEKAIAAAVRCKNNEEVVKAIANAISAALKKDGKTSAIVTIAEKSKKEDPPALATVTITSDGEYEIISMSQDYNSARNLWIRGQFSPWDGSHDGLKKMIKANLNDEGSFKHIETTYIDVSDEDAKERVNSMLKKAGYSKRVEVGDLLITTKFSAKNAFGGRVKNTAIGIASYKDNSIKLVNIG